MEKSMDKSEADYILSLFKKYFDLDVDIEDVLTKLGSIEDEAVKTIADVQFRNMTPEEFKKFEIVSNAHKQYLNAVRFIKNYRTSRRHIFSLLFLLTPLIIVSLIIFKTTNLPYIIVIFCLELFLIWFNYRNLKKMKQQSSINEMKANKTFFGKCDELLYAYKLAYK